MDFNKEQKQAIESIDKNVGLIAGAGTGKTAVISERFIKIIKAKDQAIIDSLDEVLCITFTEKASEEMKDRISSSLKELLASSDDFAKDAIIGNLNISTIHSFCNEIIKSNTFKLGISMEYEIIQGYKTNNLLRQVITSLVEKKKKNEEFKNFLIEEKYLNISDLVRELMKAYRLIQSKGYDIDELILKIKDFDLNIDYQKRIREYYDLVEELLEEKIINGRLNLVKKYKAGAFEKLLDDQYINDQEKIEDLYELKKDFSKASKYEDLNKILESIDEIILSISSKYLYKYETIHEILKEIDQEFKSIKLKESLMEYDDLLYYTNKLLEDKSVIEPIKEKYSHIMIDEFQDTNKIQRDIFFKICSNYQPLDRNNLFVVGDPKQAIYGFRGSDLKVFYEAIDTIKNANGQIIDLNVNYRSTDKLIGFYNNLFTSLMGDKYSNLKGKDYGDKDEEEKLEEERSEIKIIEFENTCESDALARKIIDISKDYKFSEIGILFRSSSKLPLLEESLDNYNIPYINPKSKEFYNKREIKDLILFLKFLNIPKDDHSLYGLLRSDFFLIEDYKLEELISYSESSLYENLLAYNLEDKKIIRAKDILKNIVKNRDNLTIYENLRSFIDKSLYFQYLAGVSTNKQRIENVNKFLDISLEFSLNENGFLNEFLSFLDQESSSDEGEADLDSGEAVNLLTIHSSKGLQYKVVFIYDGNKGFYYPSETIKIHGDHGYAMNFLNCQGHYDKVNQIIKNEDLEEELRIFYVGLTRAKSRLYFLQEKDRKINNNSYLSLLNSVEGLEIPREADKVLDYSKKYNMVEIESDQSQLGKDQEVSYKRNIISSISAYMTFKSCRRKYYYTYILNLDKLDLDQDIDENLLYEETSMPMTPVDYGSFIHSLIENYDNSDLDKYISLNLDYKNISFDEDFFNKIKRHLENYLKADMPGRNLFEYAFILDLEKGRIQGSIDQIILGKDFYNIVDFKTNSWGKIEDLINYYKPQLIIYSLAASKIFKKEGQGVYINFLDFNQLIEIEIEKNQVENLLADLNKFLSFIGQHDSIDLYKCNENCQDKCKYKNICIG